MEQVCSTRLCTCLDGAFGVRTVEHLLAALWGLGLTDAELWLEGEEVPVLDGSAASWVQAIDEAGLAPLDGCIEAVTLSRPLELSRGLSRARLLPRAQGLRLEVGIDFDNPGIGQQRVALDVEPTSFREQLSWARTFGRLEEVELLRSAGFARGGDLENAVVFGPDGAVLNPGGLRSPDEPVRHKALDLIGDLALLGRPLSATLEVERPGHALTLALMQALAEVAGVAPLAEGAPLR
jgi:UDP-3-O-[3-hydroxymyristoyl] N-acetylglucosamine deacetylase